MRLARSRARAWCLLFAIGAVCVSAPVRAGEGAASSAAAEALFMEARALLEKGELSAACDKFKASRELDPQLGTLLRLADCYDRDGKTASAWALFREATTTAAARGEPEREQIAKQRALDLEGRLSKIVFKLDPPTRPPGFQVRLNGAVVPSASYDTALPVDPGPQRIEVAAPDHQPYNVSVDVPVGPVSKTIELPALTELPKPAAPAGASPSAMPDRASGGHVGGTQRAIGYVSGGLGVAALAAGGVLAWHASQLKSDSLKQCRRDDPNACTPEGVALRGDAMDYAKLANYPMIGGGILLAGAITLIVTAPSSKTAAARTTKVRANVAQGPVTLGLSVESEW